MAIDENDKFGIYRRKAARAAQDLYGKQVANQIMKAASEAEITRILITARNKLP